MGERGPTNMTFAILFCCCREKMLLCPRGVSSTAADTSGK